MEALQDACSKVSSYINFDKLPLGEHKVADFHKVSTQFGPRIRVSVDDQHYMFLPERLSSLNAETLKKLNQKPRIMVYSGKDRENNDRLNIEFKESDPIDVLNATQ